jgi:hypothetical protein
MWTRTGGPFCTAVLLLLLSGCGDHTTEPRQELASLVLSANVSGTSVSTLVVTVSAADIPASLVFNLAISGGVAAGTLQVPPGSARTFLAQAFDASGALIHEGSATVDVQRGVNPPLTIVLLPRAGEVPITVRLGSFSVVVSPASFLLEPGVQLQLSASITDANGDPVNGAEPTWATSNPSRATVSTSGVVSALLPGEVQIVAVYRGMVGSSMLVVGNTAGEVAAHAGPDQDVDREALITLDGTASTGAGLLYRWRQIEGPSVGSLSGVSPSFVAPADVTTLVFQLVVESGSRTSAPDTVTIQVMEEATNGVWVGLRGSDSNSGTRAAAMRTLGAAVSRAAVTGADVYVAEGVYDHTAIYSGVSLYGGYRETDWLRDQARFTTTVSGISGLTGRGVSDLTISGLRLEMSAASFAGASAYGIRLSGAQRITIRDNVIVVGPGRSGAAGANGRNGDPGAVGVPGSNGNADADLGGDGGNGGTGAHYGGRGGRGGYSQQNGDSGSPGSGPAPGGGGGGGNWGNPGRAGLQGQAGAQGAAGSDGARGAEFFDGQPAYHAGGGGNGAAGTHGSGGGGGGGGGGQSGLLVQDGRGNGGGGGGGGGNAGTGGQGGGGGGSSIGILLIDSQDIIVQDNTIRTGGGGAGGAGGTRGTGGGGGAGGVGASHATSEIGAGGPGGSGGNGGHGGHGAGGNGGAAIGILRAGGSATLSGNSFTNGSGGAGGTGSGVHGRGGISSPTEIR